MPIQNFSGFHTDASQLACGGRPASNNSDRCCANSLFLGQVPVGPTLHGQAPGAADLCSTHLYGQVRASSFHACLTTGEFAVSRIGMCGTYKGCVPDTMMSLLCGDLMT